MALTAIVTRARAYFVGMAVLLGLLGIAAEAGSGSLLIGVALVAVLVIRAIAALVLPVAGSGAEARPQRARAPGVILPSTHPDAAGHSRPRAPGP